MDDFKVWYKEQPLVTRTYLAICLTFSALVSFGFLSYGSIALDYELTIKHFQLWRLFTNFFFLGTFSFNLLFALFLMFFALSRLESLFDKKNISDYIYLILISMLVFDLVGLMVGFPFLSKGLQTVLIYIWCKRRPLEIVQFFFGLKIKSAYFPFFLAGYHLLIGENIFIDVVGIGIGHCYIFIKDILPFSPARNSTLMQLKHKDILRTPRFFDRFVKKYLIDAPAQGQGVLNQNQQQQQRQQFNAFQGRGVQIG